MNQLTHIGLDVHKDTIAVAVLRPDTTDCDERVIPKTSEAVRRLLSRHRRPSELTAEEAAGLQDTGGMPCGSQWSWTDLGGAAAALDHDLTPGKARQLSNKKLLPSNTWFRW